MPRPRTKLVCTIGPASVERARELVDAGMSVARINFSHGTPESQKQAVHAMRAAAHHARRSVAVMVDLPGRKIRLGELPGDELELETGATFELVTNRPALAGEVQPGDRILLADGAVELVVLAARDEQPTDEQPTDEQQVGAVPAEEQPTDAEPVDEQPTDEQQVGAVPAEEQPTDEQPVEAQPTDEQPADSPADEAAVAADTTGHAGELPPSAEPRSAADEAPVAGVPTRVVRGGLIRSHAGVNVPSDRLAGEALTDADRAALPRALELRADIVAQSFVRGRSDLEALRALLPQPGPRLVAKIETRAAVEAFDEILEVADGVMVARGDLGVDMPYEKVPLVQKDLIRRAHAAGRFTIVATQMLESMTSSPRPTRAEASDVANAVLDGADALMLSAETAIGAYPVEAARTMLAICSATETALPLAPLARPMSAPTDDAEAICRAAVGLADGHPSAAAIWCFTRTGRTAEMLALLRPRVPILAFTINAVAARRIAVRSGVIPLVMPAERRGESLVEQMGAVARAQGVLPEALPATVVLVTTSTQERGINRLELHFVA